MIQSFIFCTWHEKKIEVFRVRGPSCFLFLKKCEISDLPIKILHRKWVRMTKIIEKSDPAWSVDSPACQSYRAAPNSGGDIFIWKRGQKRSKKWKPSNILYWTISRSRLCGSGCPPLQAPEFYDFDSFFNQESSLAKAKMQLDLVQKGEGRGKTKQTPLIPTCAEKTTQNSCLSNNPFKVGGA